MTRIATTAALIVTLGTAPVLAEEPSGDFKEGMDLLSQGTRLLFQGLLSEIEPALRELEGALNDLNAYHPPEVLPNGDIILRRKTPLQPAPPAEGGEIEL
ncbi:MAG: hypothetical protein ACE368_01845 [Paracoccaceae bacterium]